MGIYLIVSIAAQAVAGPEFLQHNKSDVLSSLGSTVFGSPLDKLLIIAVLTSAAASTQTTILPTARTSLSMGAARALPKIFARVHPRHQTPDFSTLLMGAFSIAWYVGLTIVSEDILGDSITALGLMIAFYYGLTGFACAIYYRRELLSSAKAFFAAGVMPFVGGAMLTYIFFKSASDLATPGKRDVLGIGPPLAIAIAFGILGIAFMILQRINSPEFFRRKPEVAPKGSLIHAPTSQASFASDSDAPGGGV
jgi:amino acid transporter